MEKKERYIHICITPSTPLHPSISSSFCRYSPRLPKHEEKKGVSKQHATHLDEVYPLYHSHFPTAEETIK